MAKKTTYKRDDIVRLRFTPWWGIVVDTLGANRYAVRLEVDGSVEEHEGADLVLDRVYEGVERPQKYQMGYLYLVHTHTPITAQNYYVDTGTGECQYVPAERVDPAAVNGKQRSQYASHYLGWADDVEERLKAHADGTGARLLQVARERGITWEVVWVARGTRQDERDLKAKLKNARFLCPICHAAYLAERRAWKRNRAARLTTTAICSNMVTHTDCVPSVSSDPGLGW